MDKTQNEQFLDRVIAFWQPFYPQEKLTREDARQMIETVGSVFDLLNEWSEEEKRGEKCSAKKTA